MAAAAVSNSRSTVASCKAATAAVSPTGSRSPNSAFARACCPDANRAATPVSRATNTLSAPLNGRFIPPNLAEGNPMSEPLPPIPGPDAPSEPLLSIGAITTIVTAVLALAVAFGAPISDAQQAAILAVIAVVAPIIVTLVGRTRVFSPATVRALVARTQGRPS